MSAIIKSKPVTIDLVVSPEEAILLQRMAGKVPPAYRIHPAAWRILVGYTDYTRHQVRLVDGRIMRTRHFKENWRDYTPAGMLRTARAEEEAQHELHGKAFGRVLRLAEGYPTRGNLRGVVKLNICHIHYELDGRTSEFTWTVNNWHDWNMLMIWVNGIQWASSYTTWKHRDGEKQYKILREMCDEFREAA